MPSRQANRRFDVRIALGSFFAPVGALLALFGLMASRAAERDALGMNVDLWWGLVLCAFGTGMLMLAWRARR